MRTTRSAYAFVRSRRSFSSFCIPNSTLQLKPHAGAGNQSGCDDPADYVFERDHEQEEPENINHDSDHARQAFANAMNQSPARRSAYLAKPASFSS